MTTPLTTPKTATFLSIGELEMIVEVQKEFNKINREINTTSMTILEQHANRAVETANEKLRDYYGSATKFTWEIKHSGYEYMSQYLDAEFHWFLVDAEAETGKILARPSYNLTEDWVDFPALSE